MRIDMYELTTVIIKIKGRATPIIVAGIDELSWDKFSRLVIEASGNEERIEWWVCNKEIESYQVIPGNHELTITVGRVVPSVSQAAPQDRQPVLTLPEAMRAYRDVCEKYVLLEQKLRRFVESMEKQGNVVAPYVIIGSHNLGSGHYIRQCRCCKLEWPENKPEQHAPDCAWEALLEEVK